LQIDYQIGEISNGKISDLVSVNATAARKKSPIYDIRNLFVVFKDVRNRIIVFDRQRSAFFGERDFKFMKNIGVMALDRRHMSLSQFCLELEFGLIV